jgi:hypothetical protein
MAHYHAERNHQGIGNQLPIPGEEVGRTSGEIESRERLGGLLHDLALLLTAAVREQPDRVHSRPCMAVVPNG